MTARTVPPPPREWIGEILSLPASALNESSGIHVTEGWDSFSQVQIMVYLEETYGVEIDESTIEKYSTFANIETLHRSSIWVLSS